MGEGAPHALSIGAIAERLGTVVERGLTAEEAAARLSRHGPNELARDTGPSAADILVAQLTFPMILLLAAAGVLSAALGDVTEAVLIAVVVVLNAWIGFRQEYRAEKAHRCRRLRRSHQVGLPPRRAAARLEARHGKRKRASRARASTGGACPSHSASAIIGSCDADRRTRD